MDRDQDSKEARAAAAAFVAAAEAKRTLADKEYASRVDELVPKACRIATRSLGPKPPHRDPMRRPAWDQAWSREFHKAMDELCSVKGLRTQSHQV